MALDQSALLEVLDALKAADVGDRVRQAAETVYQALIEAELTDVIGAGRHERCAERTNQRNGHRTRTLTTTAGDLELRIPKLRTGSFFPRTRGVEGCLRSCAAPSERGCELAPTLSNACVRYWWRRSSLLAAALHRRRW